MEKLTPQNVELYAGRNVRLGASTVLAKAVINLIIIEVIVAGPA